MGPLTEPREAHRIDLVPAGPQRDGHRTPRPGAQKEPRNQYECRHAQHATVNTGHIPPGFKGRILAPPPARVLALLEILQAGGTFTVADLATRLGVDERTLRRYAAHLTELGI